MPDARFSLHAKILALTFAAGLVCGPSTVSSDPGPFEVAGIALGSSKSHALAQIHATNPKLEVSEYAGTLSFGDFSTGSLDYGTLAKYKAEDGHNLDRITVLYDLMGPHNVIAVHRLLSFPYERAPILDVTKKSFIDKYGPPLRTTTAGAVNPVLFWHLGSSHVPDEYQAFECKKFANYWIGLVDGLSWPFDDPSDDHKIDCGSFLSVEIDVYGNATGGYNVDKIFYELVDFDALHTTYDQIWSILRSGAKKAQDQKNKTTPPPL